MLQGFLFQVFWMRNPAARPGLLDGTFRFMVLVAVVFAVAAAPVGAQSASSGGGDHATPPPTAKTHPNDPMIWNVDQMMENAVLQISRRYNLTKDQENYTRLILTHRVRLFLKDYETDVRELLKDSIDMRLGRQAGTSEALKKWAKRAEPVYQAAMKAILDGNKEWGSILDDQQKKTHEADLAAMRTSFDSVNRMMRDWKLGKGQGFGPSAKSGGAQQQGQVSPNPPAAVVKAEDIWMQYVNKFIGAYRLDGKQTAAVRAIHKELLAQAANYRSSRKKDFDQVLARISAAQNHPARKRLEDMKYTLEKPIRDRFVELERRLNDQLTRKQRLSIASDQESSLRILADDLSGRRHRKAARRIAIKPAPDKKPTSRPSGTTRPAPSAKKPAVQDRSPSDKGSPDHSDPAPKGQNRTAITPRAR
ncbi:MAG: hypothetical protein ACE5F9_04790 [Phycisphaerae bacterium]